MSQQGVYLEKHIVINNCNVSNPLEARDFFFFRQVQYINPWNIKDYCIYILYCNYTVVIENKVVYE